MSDQSYGSMRNYSAFDVELTHQALNFRLFVRLLRWLRPYRITLFTSIALVIVAAAMSVLMPVITGRVIIDSILLPNPDVGDLPDYGLIDLTSWISATLNVEALTAAGLIYIILVLFQAFFMFGHQLTLASSSLKALRDLRLDLFASLERKPARFYDNVAVGRVMTRVSNDVENLSQFFHKKYQMNGRAR